MFKTREGACCQSHFWKMSKIKLAFLAYDFPHLTPNSHPPIPIPFPSPRWRGVTAWSSSSSAGQLRGRRAGSRRRRRRRMASCPPPSPPWRPLPTPPWRPPPTPPWRPPAWPPPPRASSEGETVTGYCKGIPILHHFHKVAFWGN